MDTVSPFAPDNNPQKRCSGPCGRLLPATPEFFHRATDRKSGMEAQCKECKANRQRAHFSKPEARQRRKDYFNQPEIQERTKAWQEEYYSRPDIRAKNLAYHRENNKRPERKEKTLAHSRKPEIRERNRAYLKAYNSLPEIRAKRLSPENRPQWRVNAHTRRARKKAVQGSHTPAQIQEQLERQKRKCYYCSTPFRKAQGKYVYHVDHTFPISRIAGSDIPGNDISYLVLACPHCNDSKRDKFPWEWPEGGRLL